MNISITLSDTAPGFEHVADVDADIASGEVALHDAAVEDDRDTVRTCLLYSAEDALKVGLGLVAAARAILQARQDEAGLAADRAWLDDLTAGTGEGA